MRDRAALTIGAAFLAVYVIWGSTYLAIRWAIDTMPPLLMAGARWVLAGGLLLAWRLAVTRERPTWAHLRTGAVVGTLLIFGGNGLVSVAEQWVPSGVTALLIAIVPLWIAVFEWLGPARVRPAPRVLVGIALGLAGVALLVGPAALLALGGAGTAGLVGAALILVATVSWASGSLWSRQAPRPRDLLLGAALQMVAGGIVLTVVGLAVGEGARVDLAGVTARSWLSWGFLVVFGSIVAYSAYVWLLQVVRAELVATYAFVNPVVAVLLGTLLAGEPFGVGTAVVAALIAAGVALIVTAPRPPPSSPAVASAPSPKKG
ncbi:MAG TPA: EamA family transporter [Candidatus Thermoplasmatota archaeon]|nr:EamA family transporter [Candidatus Thermoplasmatota archaeon]